MPITHIRTINIGFVYDDGYGGEWDLEAQVEKDGIDSYTCVDIVGAEDVKDELWRLMAAKAEELACERDNQPRNRAGCECPPYGEGTLAEMIHDDTCPIKLSKDERKAYDRLPELDAEQMKLDDPSWVYLNLK